MSGRWSIKGIMIVVALSILALVYLYQHSCSVRATQRLLLLEENYRLEEERVESLQVEVERLKSFCRLESLWVANRDMLVAEEMMAVESLRVAVMAQGRFVVR